ncbi:tonsoku-like protein [Anopheles albimanus]|uniref:Tonsoku-like protein n=1 Tax=Anopheles albimanus TaxID=7167 RepID=A0A182FD46_ANOAL|nr:tonsoku-like protein [Anopheles albimanus]
MAYDERKLIRKKTKYANEDNYLSLAETCERLGELYKEREEHQRALNEYKLAAKAYEKLNRRMERGLAFRMIGEMYLMLGQFKEALQNVQAYMRAAQNEGNRMEMQRAHVTIGRVHLHRAECQSSADAEADLVEAEKAFHKGLEICKDLQGSTRKHDLMEMEAGIYLNLGVTLDRRGKPETAQQHMERAIRLARDADLFELLHTCYSTMALSTSRWERKEGSGGPNCGKTLRLLNQALEVASRLQNRASKMCQTLLLKGEFFIRMGDFQSARQTLKKAYRLKTPVSSDAKVIERQLKVLVAMCRTEDDLITTDATDYARRKTLYERMGDGSCKLRNFPKAIGYYTRMLECAEAAGEVNRQLIPCYVSLYQTYTDNRQYDEALDFLWKEHAIISDEPKEAYHTLLQIAKLYESQKSRSFFETSDIYRKAQLEARKLGSTELEKVPIQRAVKLLRANCMDLMAEDLEREAVAAGIDLGTGPEPDSEELPDSEGDLLAGPVGIIDEELQENDHETPNIGDDVQLDVDLSDDADSDGQSANKSSTTINDLDSTATGVTPGSRTRKRGTTFAVRRNNKGETQLHQAAISGNKALAERLIIQGHPVNVRDHAGWLPLHEACIHGHTEIVELLLDRGAHLNDKGGTSCDGITPLYDACSNGRLDVVELLLERGANATHRTDFGDTALNVLDKWYTERKPGSLSSEESAQYSRIRELLVTKFDAAAIQTSPQPTVDDSVRSKSSRAGSRGMAQATPDASASPKRRSLRWTSSGTASSGYGSAQSVPSKHRNMLPDQDSSESSEESQHSDKEGEEELERKRSGVKEYRSAMQALRKTSNGTVTELPTKSRLSLSAQKKRLAHMTMEEVDADDWLIDDLQQSAKRSRVSHNLHNSLLDGQQLRRSSSYPSPKPVRKDRPVDEEPSTVTANHSRIDALVDSEDSEDDLMDSGCEREARQSVAAKDTGDSAFSVLMNNSSRSFRRIKQRRGSAELRSSLSRRYSSGQVSLVDAGFQRVASPTLEEKENQAPPATAELPSPAKRSLSPRAQAMVASSESIPPSRTVHVTLDNGVTIAVNLEGRTTLATLTIGWFCNEVIKSYMILHGKRPVIKLRPVENGSTLRSFSETEPLTALIGNCSSDRSVVFAQILDWERINLDQFYDDYVQEHNLANDNDLRKELLMMDRNEKIALEVNFARNVPTVPVAPAHVLSMVFSVIFFQQDWLNHLDLSLNGITDQDMTKFVRYLPSFQHLRVLRLAMNLLTSRAIEMLCFSRKEQPSYTATVDSTMGYVQPALGAGQLTELDLSHNPLHDTALVPLGTLCNALPNLRILRIRSTQISNFIPSEHPTINIARLVSFDISENKLSTRSIESLLQLLIDGQLKEANFSTMAVLCNDFKPKLWQTITDHRLDSLRLLSLRNCRLTDEELETCLLPALGRNCEKLIHLDLSLNVRLTNRSFLALLRHCATASYRLEHVRFDHSVQLLVNLDTYSTRLEELLEQIELSSTAHYPQEIYGTLPARNYSADRQKLLLELLENLWRRIWATKQAYITTNESDRSIKLSVD